MSITHQTNVDECYDLKTELIEAKRVVRARYNRSFILRRNVVAILTFFGTMNLYSLRSNISVALMDMTSNKTLIDENGNSMYKREFDWDSKDIGIILSSFSFGLMVASPIGGFLAFKYGGVKMTTFGSFLAGALTVAIPLTVTKHAYSLIILRFLEGVSQSIARTALPDVWAHWFPPNEQSRLVSVCFLGSYVGPSISFAVSGYMAKYYGWPSIFYVTGGLDILWSLLWLWEVRENPSSDPRISEKELVYLSNAIKCQTKEQRTYPWIKLFTLKPVVACYLTYFFEGSGSAFFRNLLPLYVKDLLGYDIRKIGYISAMSIVPAAVSYALGGFIKNYVQNKHILTRTQASKILVIVGFVCSCSLLLLAGFSINRISVFLFVTLFPLFHVLVVVAIVENPNELSREYASIIYGNSQFIHVLAQTIAPLIVGFVVVSHEPLEWRIVLCIFATFGVSGMFIYTIFGSSERLDFSENDKSIELTCSNTN